MTKLYRITLSLFLCIFTFSTVEAQTFIVWNEGTAGAAGSGLTTITGTFPGGTVTVTNTGTGNNVSLGAEFNTLNLNGAVAAEIFGSFGATSSGNSKSLTFTFSTPVIINSFSAHDIDQGTTWFDGFNFPGVNFTSVSVAGGVVANVNGTTATPLSIGNCTEYATWFTSTTAVTSFTLNFYPLTGLGNTHAYLGYSMEVTPGTNSLDIIGDTVACVGDSVLLTAINDSIHSWALVSSPTNIISTDSAIWVTPSTTTNYMVYGTVDTAYHSVQVIQAIPDFSFGNDTTICAGQSVLLDATSANATSYLWQNTTTLPTLTATQTGLYWATASNYCFTQSDSINITVVNLIPPFNFGPDLTLCNGVTHVLNATSANTTAYLWQDASTNPTFSVTTDGTYYAEASNYCGTQSDTINITFLDLVQPFSLGNDTLICAGATITWDATDPNATSYLWQDGSTNPTFTTGVAGNYAVQVSNQCGTETDAIVLNIQVLNVDLGPDQQICEGTSVTLDAGSVGTTYTWNDMSSNQTKLVNMTGTYYVDVQIQNCFDSDTVFIEVQDLNPSFSTPDVVGCEVFEMNTGFIDASSVNFGTINAWDWTFGDGNTTVAQNPLHTYQTAGSYTVGLTITTNLGCSETYTIPNYILVHPTAIADFYFGVNSGYIMQTNYYTNNSSNATSYSWNFGDGNFSSEENPEYEYNEADNYAVTLTATNQFGCSDQITKMLEITSPPVFFIPNSFTPNGDEFNTSWEFVITDIDFQNFELLVYNRWGQLVWETHDPAASWDGTFNGTTVPDGTYTWIMRCSDKKTDEKYVRNGHVNVIK